MGSLLNIALHRKVGTIFPDVLDYGFGLDVSFERGKNEPMSADVLMAQNWLDCKRQ